MLSACNLNGTHHKHKVKVHRYVTHTKILDDDLVTYWYLMYGNSNNCFYYSSPSPVPARIFGVINWSVTLGKPSQLSQEGTQQLEDEQIDVNALSQEMQADVEANPNEITEIK